MKPQIRKGRRNSVSLHFVFCRSLYEITVHFFSPQVKILESYFETSLWLALDPDRLCFYRTACCRQRSLVAHQRPRAPDERIEPLKAPSLGNVGHIGNDWKFLACTRPRT